MTFFIFLVETVIISLSHKNIDTVDLFCLYNVCDYSSAQSKLYFLFSSFRCMRVFDSHLHLQRSTSSQYYDKIPSLLPDFLGIASTNPSDWNEVKALAKKFPLNGPSSSTKVIPCYGYHPWWVKEDLGLDITSSTSASSSTSSPPEWINTLETILIENDMSVVGECGLDKITAKNEIKLFKARKKEEENDNDFVEVSTDKGESYQPSSSIITWQDLYAKQKEVFRLQLKLAVRLNKPLVVHCVSAFGDLFDILIAEEKLPKAIYMHAYGGSVDFAQRLIKLETNHKKNNTKSKKIKFYFGFSAAINQSKRLLSVIESIPHDRLLLESDLEETCRVDECLQSMLHIMADVRGVSIEDIAETTYQNALNFYNLQRK